MAKLNLSNTMIETELKWVEGLTKQMEDGNV